MRSSKETSHNVGLRSCTDSDRFVGIDGCWGSPKENENPTRSVERMRRETHHHPAKKDSSGNGKRDKQDKEGWVT